MKSFIKINQIGSKMFSVKDGVFQHTNSLNLSELLNYEAIL